jgi:hypothetical protein
VIFSAPLNKNPKNPKTLNKTLNKKNLKKRVALAGQGKRAG